MRSIQRPVDAAGVAYAMCISKIVDPDLKGRHESIVQDIEAEARRFERDVEAVTLHTWAVQQAVGVVTKDEMVALYDRRMAKQDSPGRAIYDRIKISVSICPLCGQRSVSTLDHHLPKSLFPSLAVTPLNLVPSCYDCNRAKLASRPATADEETLHPYFDDIGTEKWLFAVVLGTAPLAVRFEVRQPRAWTRLLMARVEAHMRQFRLAKLYASQAAVELANIRQRLEGLYARAGVKAVRLHLGEESASRLACYRNSWQAALYEALSTDDVFCDGGFRNIAQPA
jgi:5-methylcytosine-specific restriction endonuclease McrA